MTEDRRVVSGETGRIGVLGGSFDPIHNGHLVIARAAARKHGLPRVLFVPNNIPPHKESGAVASATHRLEMVRLALLDDPTFDISRVEIDRPGRSYSYFTATALMRRLPEADLLFIIGSDCLWELGTWYRAGELAGMVRLVFGVGTRAVNRSDDDYTRIVALNAPARRPETNFDEVREYAQRRVDVLDLEANQLMSYPFEDIEKRGEKLRCREICGVRFVKLIGREGWGDGQ